MEEFNFSLLELEKNPGFLLEKNIQQVTISDAELSSDKNRFVKLIKLIEKQVPEVHFTFYISPSIIDKEIVENLSSIACTLQIDFLSEYLLEKRKFFSKKIRLLNDYGLVFGFNIDSANFPTIKSFKNALDEAINYYPNHIYINNEKLHYACELLQNTNMKINEIFNLIANTPGSNDKKELLKENLNETIQQSFAPIIKVIEQAAI